MRTASGIPLGARTMDCEGHWAAEMFRPTGQASAGDWRRDHVRDAQKQDHLKALAGW